MEWWFFSFLQIFLINIILSGDNALVIAMASRKLPQAKQKLAIFWGAFGAIVLRVLLTIVAVQLLQIPFLMAAGAVLLVWVAIKLLVDKDEEKNIQASHHLGMVVMTIVMADFIMSVDNVIAIAAAAKGDLWLIILGLVISIPIIIWGSGLILKLLDLFPAFLYVGAAILGFTAGEMLIGDRYISEIFQQAEAYPKWSVPALVALFVTVFGWTWNKVKTV